MTTSKSSNGLSRTLQITFIVGILAMMLSQLVYSVIVYLQAPGNTMSAWEWVGVSYGVPLVITIAAFLSRRDRTFSVKAIFETLLLVTAWFCIFSVVSVWAYQLFFQVEAFREGPSVLFTVIQVALPLVIVGVGMLMTILHLRRQKQW